MFGVKWNIKADYSNNDVHFLTTFKLRQILQR